MLPSTEAECVSHMLAAGRLVASKRVNEEPFGSSGIYLDRERAISAAVAGTWREDVAAIGVSAQREGYRACIKHHGGGLSVSSQHWTPTVVMLSYRRPPQRASVPGRSPAHEGERQSELQGSRRARRPRRRHSSPDRNTACQQRARSTSSVVRHSS